MAMVLCVASTAAKADYFLWEDPATHLTITFPDTWKVTHNQDANDIFTVNGPDTNGYPKCVVKARDDKRYVIFPPRYGRSIQHDALSKPFWEAYLGDYQDYMITDTFDDAGMGRWHASYAQASYTNYDGSVYENRGAIMFASLYYDTMYIVECSAVSHAYERWYPAFTDIIKSIDFQQTYNESPVGHYRNFLTDAERYFWVQAEPHAVTGY